MHRLRDRLVTGIFAAALLVPASAAPMSALQAGPPSGPDVSRAADEPEPELRGRVTLADGSALEGVLTWNRHASRPSDVIEGLRGVSEDGLRFRRLVSERNAADRRRSVDLPGVRVTWEEEDPDLVRLVSAGVRLHWVDALVPADDALLVELRTGETLELRPAGTDLGPGFGGLEIEGVDGAVRALGWDGFTRVELLHDRPLDGSGVHGLRGTVQTAAGETLSGAVAWDLDESRAWHRLDGEAEGEPLEIEFSRIVRIERTDDGDGVRVLLESGDRVTLDGSNDVGPENRGIGVIDGEGELHVVAWTDFRVLDLRPGSGIR